MTTTATRQSSGPRTGVRTRGEDPTPGERIVRTICGACHANCGLLLHVADGRIVRVEGDPEHPLNRGYLCVKGQAIPEIVHSPDRLTHPLIRTGEGFREASWDEALDLIAERLLALREKDGPEALVWSGGAVVNEETVERFVQLTAAYGSPNIAGSGHLCSIPRRIGLESVYGPPRSEPDYDNARLIIMWGANPLDSQRPGEGVSYQRYHQVLARARRRRARIIAIDPFATPTVRLAHQWLRIRPGTDLALALAMMHVIIEEELFDKDFVRDWVEGFEELREHVRDRTPAWAASITGLPAEDITDLARTYATTKPAAIREGNGLDMHPDVVAASQAVGILSAITGNLDVKGGNVIPVPVPLSPVPSSSPARKSLSADRYPLFPSTSFPAVVDALITGEPYRPKAMIIFHANPVLVNANETRVREALGHLEFLVVSDIFRTATTELADVVLPDTSDFEREGFQAKATPDGWVIGVRQKAVEPPGEARSAFEVELDLARRMGLEEGFPWRTAEEWINYRLKPTGLTYAELHGKTAVLVERPPVYRKYESEGFKTPSGKVEVVSRRFREVEQEPLPAFHGREEDPATRERYPLAADTRKAHNYVHTKFRNAPSLTKAHPQPLVLIHPQDAQRRGIASGDRVLVESPVSSLTAEALVTEDAHTGAVLIDFGWGNPGDGGDNVNRLSTDAVRDPVSSSTPNRAIQCEVTKL